MAVVVLHPHSAPHWNVGPLDPASRPPPMVRPLYSKEGETGLVPGGGAEGGQQRAASQDQ